MDFINKRKTQTGIKSMGDLIRSGSIKSTVDPSKFVKGPVQFDCMVRPWCRGDMMGLLAGTGIGKTTTMLNIFKGILENNLDNDDIVVFVSLEMSTQEIAEKWHKLVGDSPVSDRLYVVENYDEHGKAKNLGTKGIKLELIKLRETLGVKIIAWCLDHLHITNVNGTNDYNPICDEYKQICMELDTFGVVLSQTTKGKGAGDIPVPKDGCYGASKFEWNCAFILTIFQPLLKIQSKVNLPILAFQYAKIRYKNRNDKVKESMNYLLHYNFDTEYLRELNNTEKAQFAMHYEEVLMLRQNEEKFKSFQFDISTTVEGKDGKRVHLHNVIGGKKPESADEDL